MRLRDARSGDRRGAGDRAGYVAVKPPGLWTVPVGFAALVTVIVRRTGRAGEDREGVPTTVPGAPFPTQLVARDQLAAANESGVVPLQVKFPELEGEANTLPSERQGLAAGHAGCGRVATTTQCPTDG
jgi:hypothetical protein